MSGQQHSLFDLLLQRSPQQTHAILWSMHRRARYEERVRDFSTTYGEAPVFVLRDQGTGLVVFMRHPSDALVCDGASGELVEGAAAVALIWGTGIDAFVAQRPRETPRQVLEILDGVRPRNAWSAQITESFPVDADGLDALVLLARGLDLDCDNLDSAPLESHLRVSGAPERIEEFLHRASARGLLRLLG